MTTPVTPTPPEAPSCASPPATGAFPPGARASLAGYALPVVVALSWDGALALIEYYTGSREVVPAGSLGPWVGEALPQELDGPQGVLSL